MTGVFRRLSQLSTRHRGVATETPCEGVFMIDSHGFKLQVFEYHLEWADLFYEGFSAEFIDLDGRKITLTVEPSKS